MTYILIGYAAINILAIAWFALRYFLRTRAYRRRYKNNITQNTWGNS